MVQPHHQAQRRLPLYRLVYFNSRGAVELTRYLLALVDAPYDDLRYPLTASAKGFGIDASGDFLAHKKAGHFDMNMGQLPVLQVLTPDAKAAVATLGQSHSINRFLAERHGRFGKDLLERAQMDAFYESVRDVKTSYLRSKKKKNMRRDWLEEELPNYCQKLENSLLPEKKNSLSDQQQQPWLIGDTASLADVALYSLLGTSISPSSGSLISGLDDYDPAVSALSDSPRLQASLQAMSNQPNIQQWEQNRPDTFS